MLGGCWCCGPGVGRSLSILGVLVSRCWRTYWKLKTYWLKNKTSFNLGKSVNEGLWLCCHVSEKRRWEIAKSVMQVHGSRGIRDGGDFVSVEETQHNQRSRNCTAFTSHGGKHTDAKALEMGQSPIILYSLVSLEGDRIIHAHSKQTLLLYK